MCTGIPVVLCINGRVTAQRETGVWECQEKTWLACTLQKTLWAGTMGCPAAKRYDSDCEKIKSVNFLGVSMPLYGQHS